MSGGGRRSPRKWRGTMGCALFILTSVGRMGASGTPSGFCREERAAPCCSLRDAEPGVAPSPVDEVRAPAVPASEKPWNRGSEAGRVWNDAGAMAALAAPRGGFDAPCRPADASRAEGGLCDARPHALRHPPRPADHRAEPRQPEQGGRAFRARSWPEALARSAGPERWPDGDDTHEKGPGVVHPGAF